MFESTGPHYCPVCPPVLNRRQRRLDQPLVLVERNFSGCGVDIARCPTCERLFQVAYKVAEIRDVTDEINRIRA